ncbi:MAG TPA: MFS transporter [Acidobacteriota bacterium]|nr:MFS transporter [Acidobacteriota bacterium]
MIRAETDKSHHERWNYWTMALYLSCYRVGLVLIQPDTVLPVCILNLTSQPLLVGLASSLYLFFWTFPQSLSAFYTTRVRETKPLVSLLMVLHALPWAFLACYFVFAWGSGRLQGHLGTSLLMIYAAIIAFSVLGGASIPGYMTMVGKSLVVRTRIKLLGYVWGTSAVLTLGASLIMRRLIRTVPFPLNFSIIFLLAFAVFCIAITFWAETKEPPEEGDRRVQGTLSDYYRNLFTTIRTESRFRYFLFSITLAGFALPLLMPFLAVHAVVDLSCPPETVALFLLVLMGCQSIAGYVTASFLSDKSAVFRLFLSLCFMVLVSVALLVPSLPGRIWVGYALAGLAQGFFASSYQLAMFEVSGRQDASIVIGITNTIRAPFYAVGPIFGGLLQMSVGFTWVTVTSLAFSLAALVAMRAVRISDTHHDL